MATLARSACADVRLTASDREQAAAWTRLHRDRLMTGATPAGATSFLYSDPRLNSELFSPYRLAVRSLQTLKPELKTQGSDEVNGVFGGVALDDVYDYLLCSKVTSNSETEPGKWMVHGTKLLEATDQVLISYDQAKLTTYGLVLDPKYQSSNPPTQFIDSFAPNDVQQFASQLRMKSLEVSSTISRGALRVRDELMGLPTSVDEYFSAMHREVARLPRNSPAQVSRLEASFGVSGFALQLLCVQIGEHYFLCDAHSGAVAGPYGHLQPLDATPLLNNYTLFYTPGEPVEYYDQSDRLVQNVVPLGAAAVGMPWNCIGCLACVSAVSISCGLLCGDDPMWDTIGEGFGMCMAKCILSALSIPPVEWIDIIKTGRPPSPENIAMSTCGWACSNCGGAIKDYIWKWLKGPTRGIIKIPPGWRPKCN